MDARVLLITHPEKRGPAEEAAVQYACANGCSLIVLFVLDCFLFHYGKSDWVVPGHARTQFLFHVRDDLLRQATEREAAIRAEVEGFDVEVTASVAEHSRFEEIVMEEAAKGYDRIFVDSEKRKLFPLFGRPSLAKMLQRQGFQNVTACVDSRKGPVAFRRWIFQGVVPESKGEER